MTTLEGCATDLCGMITVTSDYDFLNLSDGCGESGELTVTYTVTDECGNTSIISGTFTIEDNTAPDLSACDEDALDLIHECDGVAGNEAAADTWNAANVAALESCAIEACGIVTVTDDYDFNLLSDACGETGELTVTYTVTDECGLSTEISGTLTIEDNTAPDLTGCTDPLDGAVECLGLPDNEVSADNWNAANITYLEGCASDLCGTITVTSDYDFSNYMTTCGSAGTITVIYTVTDDCGNSTTATGTLTIEDNFGPVLINCPNLDYTIECEGQVINEMNASAWDANIIAVLEVCAQDACSDFTVSSDYDYANLVITCGEAGVLTVVYTVEDECANTSTFTAQLTIEDTTPPDLSACDEDALDLTYECSGAVGNEAAAESWNSTNMSSLEGCASDLCGTISVTSDYNFLNLSDECGESGELTVNYTVTDECGNTSTISGTLTIEDNTVPDFSACDEDALDLTHECNGVAGNEAAANSWNAANITTLQGCAVDLCGVVTVTSDYDYSVLSDECGETGELTVIYTVTDECGLSSTITGTFTIEDTTSPDLTACDEDALDQTHECDGAPGNETAAIIWNSINMATLSGCSSDLCGSTSVSNDYDFLNLIAGCGETGVLLVTYTVTDECGNTSTISGTFTIEDNTAPDLTACDEDALDQTYECDGPAGNEAAAEVWNATNIATLEGCTSDLCGGIAVSSNYDFTNLSDGCGESGELIVTYTVTDDCGNTSTISGTFTIEDTTAPDLSACDENALDLTHECDGAAGNEVAAETWNSANISYLGGCSSDLCGLVSVDSDYDFLNLDLDCGITGTLTVVYTVTDECGNLSTVSGTFTIIDTSDPTWDSAMPVDITVECDAVPIAFVATSSDGCDTDVDIAYTEVGSDSICLDTYILTRTWTATDDCNNAITHTQQIQVQDTTVPDPLCQDREIFLDENGIATITPGEVDNGSTDNCDVQLDLSLSKTSFDCDDEGPNLVTLTVTDNCSNSNTCTATVTVTDALAPIALCQDVTVSLDEFGQGSITPNDVDNGSYDNCGIASLVISQSLYDCSWLGTSVVTLTVTDIYANVSTCTANVSVVDEIPPVALCKNYFVDLNAQGEAPITYFDIDAGSTDNCSIVDYQVVPNVVTCANIPMVNVTLTVTDPGGNQKSCTATVVVKDKLAPIMACKDLTFYLDDQGSPITIQPEDIDSGSQDNCEIETLTLNKSTFDCDNLGGNVVLLTATDPSGNVGYCSATVTIVDTVPPYWTYMPGDITVNCIDAFDDNPEAADNCVGVNINWVDVQEVWPAGPMNSYLVRRTWTAFDGSGNEITYEQVVYVLPGGELLVNCNPDVITQPTHFPIKVDWPVPSVDDICEGSIDMVQIGGPAPLSYFSPGTETLITYEYIDVYGTHYQCSFWVIVPKDASGYIVVLNEIDCEDQSLTNCEVKDLPNPDNYSFEYILTNMTPIMFGAGSNANFEMFADGSAHLTGSWTDMPNTCGWDMDIWLHRRRTSEGWVDAGGNISSFSGLGDPKLWEFFEVDGSRSKMTGTGCYTGQNYNVKISPNFPKFGFQLGEGANTKTSAYGGWVIIAMTNNSDQVVAQGIFSFELDCTPTNLIKDAAEVISLDGFNYPVTWSNGKTGPELGDVSPGIYSVTVTDQSANTDASSFSLEFPTDCILYYEDDCRPGNMTSTATANQTSTYQGAGAERAIDQNSDGDFANGSVTSTLAGYQNSFSMALLDPLLIEKIRVWNRTDCCSDLLDPFYVFVSESPIPDMFPEDLVYEPNILAFYHSGPIEDSFTFDVGQMGQYVKVQLAESGRLMLAEVQVLVCQDDKVGLKDDGFTAPEEEEVVKKVQVIEDVPTVSYWPNPANDYLEIDISQQHAAPIGVTIVNMQGVEVYRAKLPADHLQHLHLNTGEWGPGVYFMTISSSNGARSLPLTIQH
ncbi:MAG: T9SS type A sorting domain-containing protein [Saprospiraceae bacterium]|nr:T9SS type A sorting domain-containing protein [Saprospiraceae bacterium]